MSRTHTFSSRPWRHTGKFSRKKEDTVNTDEDIVSADKDMVNADKEEATKDRDSQDSADIIKDIVENVINSVVEREDNAMEEFKQKRCFKIFDQVVKRRKIKKLVSFRTMRMKSLNHIMLDIIIVRMNILSINQKIKEIEEKIKRKIEPKKKEIAVVETDTRDKELKKAIATVKPNQRIEEPMEDSMPMLPEQNIVLPEQNIVLPEQNINEENYEIDDANEAQINYYDLAPTDYPWREIKKDLGNSNSSDSDDVPDLYPDSPPSLTSNDGFDSDDSEEVKIIRHIPSQSRTSSQSRIGSHGSYGEEILNSEANQDNDDDDVEIQTRNPTPTPEITINGRRYAQRTLMSRSRSGESAMFCVERRAMDPSPNEDRTNNDENDENGTNYDEDEDHINSDSEEDVAREYTHAERMQQDSSFRDWERRRRRSRASSRASSSESETGREDRIRHRSQFNPNLRTIHCPDVGGVEILNEFTRKMIEMEEIAGNSDESTGRSHGCRGTSCHCSSSERDGSDDMV